MIGGIGKHRNTLVVFFSSVVPPMSISSMASAREQPERAMVEANGYRLQTTMEMGARWTGLGGPVDRRGCRARGCLCLCHIEASSGGLNRALTTLHNRDPGSSHGRQASRVLW